ncbi:MAG: hypothetical protein RJB13_480 [Pseudomonadota bacterium]|jgi:4-hydroxy-tetrahydrodipicolinate synthase
MTTRPFTGVLTALATPFKPDLSLDIDALNTLLKAQKGSGVHGVVVCGTTGESPTLSKAEKDTLVKTALQYQDEHFKIYVGTGSNSTRETIELSQHTAALTSDGQKVFGLMIVTPYYNKPTQAGLREHFLEVARSVGDTPICLYNVPGRTGCTLQSKTLIEIAAKAENVVAVKEAAGDVRVITEIKRALVQANLSERVSILSGDDPTYAAAMLCGADGVISVTTHLIPKPMLEIWNAAQAGDFAKVSRLHLSTYPVNSELFCAPNPIPLKWALNTLGLCQNVLRPPLSPLEESGVESVTHALESIKKAGLELIK